MLEYYNSEIQGMIDFWETLNISPDYSLNTDGRYKGNLIEFKLVFTDILKHKSQLQRYVRAYNSCAFPIPKYGYLISLNQHIYIKIDNETGEEITNGTWENPCSFLEEFSKQDTYIKGWIDEFSIVAYNNFLCEKYSKIFKTKEDIKNEFISPKYLFIEPFNWDDQINREEKEESIGWLHFNMNMLGPFLLKKQLGAFFTPEKYVKIATEMLRNAIANVPKGNDYIILDRCAGTGNLERFLREEELKHCVLNTYDYTEWTTLKGLYDGRVKMIIPPTRKHIDYNNGLLTNGDALSEEFFNFCFNCGQIGIDDDLFEEDSKQLSMWLKDDNMTIIMIENPPFVEPQGGASQGKPTFTIKDKFLYKQMAQEKFDTKNVNRATENLFIWSAFKYFLRQPTDSYILFSPIKYWKSQHIIDKKFVQGYLCNRANFNATEGGIALIEWRNINTINEQLIMNSDLGKRTIKKMHSNPSKLLVDSKENAIAYLFNLSNIPKSDNGKLINNISAYTNYCKVQKAYCLSEENILIQLPLWCANCYEYVDYTEKEVVMKTGDGGNNYIDDKDFLKACFIWAALSTKTQCLSNEEITNQFCLNQNTKADKILEQFTLNVEDKTLLQLWHEILSIAKSKTEYISTYKYGLTQLNKEINIKIPSRTYNKTGKEIMIPKYTDLDEKIKAMKEELKKYYNTQIREKLFYYELLK